MRAMEEAVILTMQEMTLHVKIERALRYKSDLETRLNRSERLL